VLACEVTNLACFRVGVVAGWDLATNERVKMSHRTSAISIRWDWQFVDVVHERTFSASIGEAIEVDIEVHTGAITVRGGSNVPADSSGVAVGEGSSVGHASWVVCGNERVAQFAGSARDDRSIIGGRAFNDDASRGRRLSADKRKTRNGCEATVECIFGMF